jgi:hypothetical protein
MVGIVAGFHALGGAGVQGAISMPLLTSTAWKLATRAPAARLGEP